MTDDAIDPEIAALKVSLARAAECVRAANARALKNYHRAERNERDAARYRYLRETRVDGVLCMDDAGDIIDGSGLDDAVDAARGMLPPD